MKPDKARQGKSVARRTPSPDTPGDSAAASPARAGASPAASPNGRAIDIVGARTHNLKNISTRIPHRRLTVVTGVSGSGKSSLAFDTLYAEGQMRYVESMSAYSRQFLERMARPDVDRISGILPAIALEQRNSVKNARSTIGTATEINDYLRLLFANVGVTICPECNKPVERFTVERAVEQLLEQAAGRRVLVTAEVGMEGMSSFASLKAELQRGGFTRVLIGDEVRRLADVRLGDFGIAAEGDESDARNVRLEVVVDRFECRTEEHARAAEALETAFKLGRGRTTARPEGAAPLVFDTRFNCESCGREFLEPHPDLFSFNSALGACPTCEGFGRISGLDESKIVPDTMLSVNQGAIAPWNTPAYHEIRRELKRACRRNKINLDAPYKDLSASARKLIWEGDDEYPGVRGFFEWLDTKRYKVHVRVMIARYRGYSTCPTCQGQRLRPEALCIRVGDKTIAEVCTLCVKDLRTFFEALELPGEAGEKARILLTEVRNRLRYLDEVGLGYLTLDRQTRTLSGGEAQRINLASALGSSLTSTLYVLDEPTVGLHPRDSHRLLEILRQLIDKGNTVVVVEHDPEIICGASHVIDLGPGAGEAGGEIVFQGTFDELLQQDRSPTGRAMKHHTHRAISPYDRQPSTFLTIRAADEHNLKNIDVQIPFGVFTCVTGVSGSGKSTLINDILYAAWQQHSNRAGGQEVGRHAEIEGWDQVDDVVLVDQSPIGRSTRSNAVTYVKAYDEIRRLLAATTRARVAGVKASDFSFNVAGGRCETCKGVGTLTFDMYFMADVTVVCSECNGRKFQRKVLDIRYHDKNINDILDMTVTEALQFFATDERIATRLQPLVDVGLGYLRLGQNTATLSGGEAQRLKLASFLAAQKKDKKCLLLFDEPTTGLHIADVRVLLQVFQRLVNAGHTVLVIEHNMDLITQSDWIIDLGPEGGDEGGRIVAAGPVREVARCKASHTARFLRERIRAAEEGVEEN
ncbi:MAG: excinuclease ABC subunit UvrA [Planctomycetes bacterium]|nr:excinuclease ABC subunit UvrA [Planctomycetota bacterium]